MEQAVTIRNQCCPNPVCPMQGQLFQGNVVIHSQKDQRLKCTICQKTWVMHRETLRYRLRCDMAVVESALTLAHSGGSLRKIARKLHVSPSTVHRWKRKNTVKMLYNPQICQWPREYAREGKIV
ncbi:IS1 family transposase [Candidatus Peregrinibacteria bacterium]|nr:IS1 family transposase [Candidatus Peregrinibacteria bacterium]